MAQPSKHEPSVIQEGNRQRDWKEFSSRLQHSLDGGWLYFGCPDSEGNPTVARCERCDTFWRKAYGWEANR